ncbi:MAG: methylated-DNA--[protein]-cysteine S-methyltransferase [Candidatus Dormibacteria bacterium]
MTAEKRDIPSDLRSGAKGFRGPSADLIENTLARAESEGLVDISFGEMDSPVGPLVIAVTERGVVQVSYRDTYADALADLARLLSPRILRRPGRTDAARRELEDYFEGRRHQFSVRLDWSLIRGFGRRVLEATVAIPFGSHLTYTEVAGLAGSPRGSRAAGNALGANPIPIIIPCHRVLRAGGQLGGYTGGLHRKVHLLRLEGVEPGRVPTL